MRTPRLTVAGPGIYQMTPAQYHADPCPEPSLSASTIRTLLHLSPLHAWDAHPRLNPQWQPRTPSDEMEEGTVLHFLILGAGEPPEIVDAENWTTKAAREIRSAVRAQGRVAVLRHRWLELRRAAAAIRRECRATLGAPEGIGEGLAEAVLVWREGPVWCRCMVDWLPTGIRKGPVPLIDFKTTGRAASPEQFSKSASEMGHDIQAAWYRRGYQAVTGRVPGPLVFVAAEKHRPYGVSRVALGPIFEEMGDAKVDQGLEIWRDCLARDDWPGYPRSVGFADAPRYAVSAWESRAGRATQQQVEGSRKAAERKRIAAAQRLAQRIGGPVA